MFTKQFLSCCLVLAILAGSSVGAGAAEVECGSEYCFSAGDFSGEDTLTGICITGLPEPETGTVKLGARVLRRGDILTAEQIGQMTFSPVPTEKDLDAVVTYLPVYPDRVGASASMTISILGKEDKAPVAQDFTLETYKNLPLEGKLKVSDPENQTMVYTLVRQPKRGNLQIREDGTFTYTPKKNKVGTDSFVYTAADSAGNVSREATVTIQILKPTDAPMYTDTAGESCRFAAEWMKHTGIFVGEQLAGESCFQPDKAVTRGEFLAMLTRALDLPTEEEALPTAYADAPDWLKPYLAAALRSGMTAGIPARESGEFGADLPITGAEAAVMVQNVLDLAVVTQAEPAAPEDPGAKEMSGGEEAVEEADSEAAWADTALAVMAENGISLSAGQILTRADAAMLLYQAASLAENAPGMLIYQ